jgi:hypothetical protein
MSAQTYRHARYIAPVLFAALALGCGALKDVEPRDKDEAGASSAGSAPLPETDPTAVAGTASDGSAFRNVSGGQARMAETSTITFVPGRIGGSFDRGSSECCSPVRIGERMRGVLVTLTHSDAVVQKDVALHRLSLSFAGEPVVGKTLPVAWGHMASDPDLVLAKANSAPDLSTTWQEQAITIEGQAAITTLAIDDATGEHSLTVTFDLKTSLGALTGEAVIRDLSESIASCDKLCEEE